MRTLIANGGGLMVTGTIEIRVYVVFSYDDKIPVIQDICHNIKDAQQLMIRLKEDGYQKIELTPREVRFPFNA